MHEKEKGDRNENNNPRKAAELGRKRLVFLHHNHRSITFSRRKVSPSAIQQRRIVCPFWYRANGNVAD